MDKTARRKLIKDMRALASKENQWPMSEAEALTKALARVRRLELMGWRADDPLTLQAAIELEIRNIVNDSRYW